MNYKEILNNEIIFTDKVDYLVSQLVKGDLTKEQLHSRKAYAKREYVKKGRKLKDILEYSIAFEIANLMEKENV